MQPNPTTIVNTAIIPLLPYLFLCIIIFATVALILILIRKTTTTANSQPPDHIDYTSIPFYKTAFMRDDEYTYFLLLQKLFGEQYHIFAQVRIEDFVHSPDKVPWNRNFIKMHSVDFLVVLKTDRSKMLAIELNGLSHKEKERLDRDSHLRVILAKAGIPLYEQVKLTKYEEETVILEITTIIPLCTPTTHASQPF